MFIRIKDLPSAEWRLLQNSNRETRFRLLPTHKVVSSAPSCEFKVEVRSQVVPIKHLYQRDSWQAWKQNRAVGFNTTPTVEFSKMEVYCNRKEHPIPTKMTLGIQESCGEGERRRGKGSH